MIVHSQLIRSLLLLVACSTLFSCKLYREVEVVEVTHAQMTSFDEEGAEAEIYLQINNPNWYKVKLTQSHVMLYLDGKEIGEVQLMERMIIPKKAVSTQVMKVEANYEDMQNVLGNFLSLIFQNEFVLEGKGYVKGKAFFIARKVPVEFKEILTKKEMGF